MLLSLVNCCLPAACPLLPWTKRRLHQRECFEAYCWFVVYSFLLVVGGLLLLANWQCRRIHISTLPTPREWEKDTQEEHDQESPCSPGDTVDEGADSMSVCRSAAVCAGAHREPAHIRPPDAQPSSAAAGQRPARFSTRLQFTCPLCPRENTYEGTAPNVAAHKREPTLARESLF